MKFSLRCVTLAVCIFVALVGALPAQQTLADADWFEREIGAGVVWRFYQFDDLFGAKQSVSTIEVDLPNPDVAVRLPYLAASRQLTSAMIPAQFPESIGGMNGTYFNTTTGGHRTYLKINGAEVPAAGELFPPWGYEGALALDALDNASIVEIPPTGWSADVTHPSIMACGPLLIVEGFIPSSDLTAIGAHCTARHPRSAAGITAGNKLILLAVDGRTEMSAGMTCEELAQVLEQLGCVNALNFDGGGSTTLWGAGEQYNGVLNYPSDNGAFDHLGERACSNAIAIESTAAAPMAWDARLTGKNFSSLMESGAPQTVSLVYQNIGTETWTAANTKVVLARPASRTSDFYDADSWPAPSQPAAMVPATVESGEIATFSFVLKAPEVAVTAFFNEHFMLTQSGVGRIGPADSEAWMELVVQTPIAVGDTFIVESRLGGQNHGWYSDSGMANSAVDCTAPGSTPGIGTRFGSTFISVAGAKNATVAPDFPEAAMYNVYVAWGAGSSRRSPITYHVNYLGGTETFQIDQTATANEWVRLGTAPYLFNKGFGGSVVMTNENIDVSGSMYAGGVKFEYVAPAEPDRSYKVNYLDASQSKPSVDGLVVGTEWNAASPAASGYVSHSNPATPAAEDGSFRMLFDDESLYILLQMNNAHLASYPVPSPPYSFFDLTGDQIDFFFTPFGVSTAPFYRILMSPNPTDEKCYLWSQASLTKTTNANAGTDWVAGGDVAYSYSAGVLTIEYRVGWTAFNYGAMSVAARPENGAVWGVQPAIGNELSAGIWEYVNWEPDSTPGFVLGEPFGKLEFSLGESSFHSWGLF